MRRFLLAGVAAIALTGCTAPEDSPATVPGSALSRVAERVAANGDAATAATLYRSAIAMGNTSPDVRRGYGNALLALGQPQAAIEQYEAGLAQTKDARLYNALGVALDMLGDHARAQESFRQGLALAPDHKGLIHNYGLSLAASSDAGEKNPAIAEGTLQEPTETRSTIASAQPVRVDEPKPVLRPEAVPAVIPTVKSKPVAMRDFLPDPVPPPVAPTSNPAAMRNSLPEPVSPTIERPTPPYVPFAGLSAIFPLADGAEPSLMRTHEIIPLARPASATPLHGNYYRMRLAGYASRERALEYRGELARYAPELDEALRLVEERPSLAFRARLRYTLVSAPLPSRRTAEAACEILTERGLPCLAEPAASPLSLRS